MLMALWAANIGYAYCWWVDALNIHKIQWGSITARWMSMDLYRPIIEFHKSISFLSTTAKEWTRAYTSASSTGICSESRMLILFPTKRSLRSTKAWMSAGIGSTKSCHFTMAWSFHGVPSYMLGWAWYRWSFLEMNSFHKEAFRWVCVDGSVQLGAVRCAPVDGLLLHHLTDPYDASWNWHCHCRWALLCWTDGQLVCLE